MVHIEEGGASRAPYLAPQLIALGTLEGETQGMSTGPRTDAYFPVGTPHSQVTFS